MGANSNVENVMQNVNTDDTTEQANADEPGAAAPEVAAAEEGPYDPGDHLVDDVKAYVTEHPDQRDEVLAAEEAGKNRVTLVEWLVNLP